MDRNLLLSQELLNLSKLQAEVKTNLWNFSCMNRTVILLPTVDLIVDKGSWIANASCLSLEGVILDYKILNC